MPIVLDFTERQIVCCTPGRAEYSHNIGDEGATDQTPKVTIQAIVQLQTTWTLVIDCQAQRQM